MSRDVRCAVVVPTLNRPGALRRALSALASQSHPARLLEVVVVDAGSSPPVSQAELAPEGEEEPDGATGVGERPRVRLVAAAGAGPAAARNAGARAASPCDLLLFTDDDAEPAPGWVAAMAAAHRRLPAAALGGPVRALEPRNAYSRAYELIEQASRRAHRRFGRGHLTAANAGFPASRFSEVGGFDTVYATSEDRDLGDRWQARGLPAAFVPDAVVAHDHPRTIGEFWSTFVRYGRGSHSFHLDRRRRDRAVTGLLTSIATAGHVLTSSRSPSALALFALWQAATLHGFLAAAGRRAKGELPPPGLPPTP